VLQPGYSRNAIEAKFIMAVFFWPRRTAVPGIEKRSKLIELIKYSQEINQMILIKHKLSFSSKLRNQMSQYLYLYINIYDYK